MRNLRMPALAAAVVVAGFSVAATATADQGESREYVVVYTQGADAADARQAIEAAGGQIVDENAEIGVATVKSADSTFAEKAESQPALDGAATNKPIGYAPPDAVAKRDAIERGGPGGPGRGNGRDHKGGKREKGKGVTADPLSSLQWDMKAIGATVDGSYARQQGSHDVRVTRTSRRTSTQRSRATSRSTTRRSTARALTSRTSHATTRRTSTRTATGRTSRARSVRRSTASAWPASRPRSTSSTCAPARTRAISSSARRSTRSRSRPTTASTS
jgi:hypothetical protein